jgi:D-alanine transaminase
MIVFLNGAWLPAEQAQVSVLDRGFIFGDGVYELIPVYVGRPFRLEEHVRRLRNSLGEIRLGDAFDACDWAATVGGLIERNGGGDLSVYLQVTRGPAKRDHAFPKEIRPTVFGMATPLVTPSAELVDTGVAAVTATDYRWLRCNIKAISLLANVLLRQQAVDAGAAECILLRDGYLTEGAASNIFVVHGGVLLTPPKDHLILPGITYDLVLEIAAANAIPHEVREIPESEFRGAEEILMTSSSREVLSVTRLDGQAVGDGRPGPVSRRLLQLYREFRTAFARGIDGTKSGRTGS